MANLLTLNSANWEAEVVKSNTAVLVDFWAPWCGPCKMVAPVLDELAKELEGRVKIGKVNVDEDNALAAKYDVRSIPTLLLFKQGEPSARVVGFKPKTVLKQEIEASL